MSVMYTELGVSSQLRPPPVPGNAPVRLVTQAMTDTPLSPGMLVKIWKEIVESDAEKEGLSLLTGN